MSARYRAPRRQLRGALLVPRLSCSFPAVPRCYGHAKDTKDTASAQVVPAIPVTVSLLGHAARCAGHRVLTRTRQRPPPFHEEDEGRWAVGQEARRKRLPRARRRAERSRANPAHRGARTSREAQPQRPATDDRRESPQRRPRCLHRRASAHANGVARRDHHQRRAADGQRSAEHRLVPRPATFALRGLLGHLGRTDADLSAVPLSSEARPVLTMPRRVATAPLEPAGGLAVGVTRSQSGGQRACQPAGLLHTGGRPAESARKRTMSGCPPVLVAIRRTTWTWAYRPCWISSTRSTLL